MKLAILLLSLCGSALALAPTGTYREKMSTNGRVRRLKDTKETKVPKESKSPSAAPSSTAAPTSEDEVLGRAAPNSSGNDITPNHLGFATAVGSVLITLAYFAM